MKTKNIPQIFFGSLFFLLFAGSRLQAQSLWGTTFNGGANAGGTLVRMNPDGSGFIKFYDFIDSSGSNPMGSVVLASDGKVYGTCLNGGAYGSCVIYCYDTSTHTYTHPWDFDITHGDYPMSGLVQGPDSILYGAASAGGAAGAGVIYSFNTSTNAYTDMYELAGDSGYAPCGSPILASDGKLYGLTSGSNLDSISFVSFGNIYSYDITSGTYTDLHNFGGIKDGFAYGSLIEHNGLLYGMTSGIPQYPWNVIYEEPSVVFPDSSALNHGNIFSYDLATGTYTDLHDFDSVNGQNPYGSLFWGNNGKLYGMASAGGANNLGVIFSLDAATNTYSKLFDFDGAHGAMPLGSLMQSSDGNLYGVTSKGGTNQYGVIFRFDPVSDSLSIIISFDSTYSGSIPTGGAFVPMGPIATGIFALSDEQSIAVYPVPARSIITVDIQSKSGEDPLFTITDINGRTAWGPQAEPVDGNSQIRLDISSLISGIYFLRVTTANNVITKKIIRE